MQIIWDPEAVKKLSNSHTILELETFAVNDRQLTAYCVVPAEKIVGEFLSLDANKELHKKLIAALKSKDFAQSNTFANFP